MRRVARFDATVLILSRKNYGGLFADDFAEYSPFDLAVAWGEGAIAAVYQSVSVSQSNRFYFWKASARAWEDPRVRRFRYNSGNWHIVPESDAVMDDFFEVHEGDVVRMEGYLVDIKGPRNFVYRTSRKRSDSGPGACEIFLVTKVVPVQSQSARVSAPRGTSAPAAGPDRLRSGRSVQSQSESRTARGRG